VLDEDAHRLTKALSNFQSRRQTSWRNRWLDVCKHLHTLLGIQCKMRQALLKATQMRLNSRLCVSAPQLAGIHWHTICTKGSDSTAVEQTMHKW